MIPSHQLISLSEIPGVGPWRIRNILRKYPALENIRDLSLSDLIDVNGISPEIAGSMLAMSFDYGRRALDSTAEFGAGFLPFYHDKYPDSLKTLDDAPIGLFLQGNIPGGMSIGIVGTRAPSAYGKRLAREFTHELIQCGFNIVSGFARGIDTICHYETLLAGGSTIAVLGCGLDVNYPAANRTLRKDITEKGVVLTEFAPGTQPEAANFPRRNRIISGLSKGILIIEAGAKSGALNTAYHAVEQNREVFAIPGSIHSAKSEGCHQIIQKGAKLVTGIDDILSEFPQTDPQRQLEILPKLAGDEESVYTQLDRQSTHVDELASSLKWDTPRVLTTLLQLELKGLVRQEPGKLFLRC